MTGTSKAILDYMRQRNLPCTKRELAAAAGITSGGGISHHLEKLRRLGLIEWDRNLSRTIRLTKKGGFMPPSPLPATPGDFWELSRCDTCRTSFVAERGACQCGAAR